MVSSILLKNLKSILTVGYDSDSGLPTHYRMRFREPIVAKYKINQKLGAGYSTLDGHAVDLCACKL